MKRSEVIDLLEILAGAYPNAKIADPRRTVDAWMLAFGSDDAGEIYKAARHHMNTCRFFPTIADIQQCKYKGKLIYSGNTNVKAIGTSDQCVNDPERHLLPSGGETDPFIDVDLDWFSELGFDIGNDH